MQPIVWVAISAACVVFGLLYRMRLSSKKNKEFCNQLLQRIEQLEREKKKATDLFHLHLEKNQEFEKQRNRIWEIYRLAGLQAGTAQGMLMRELQTAYRKLNAYKKREGESPEKVSQELLQVVENFDEQHGSNRSEELRLNE